MTTMMMMMMTAPVQTYLLVLDPEKHDLLHNRQFRELSADFGLLPRLILEVARVVRDPVAPCGEVECGPACVVRRLWRVAADAGAAAAIVAGGAAGGRVV